MTIEKEGLGFRLELPSGVRVLASGDPESPVLSRFFSGYDRAFVLPDEREELSGFQKCLTLNVQHGNPARRAHFEAVAVLEDEKGELLGGANFLATAIARGATLPPASVALNYVYIEESARGRGLLRQALAAVRQLALTSLGLDPLGRAPAIFIEQNDPLRLTEEEYQADTAHSGIDQVERLAIWAHLGTKVIDFPYVQPALSPDQKADDRLIYAAVDYPATHVDTGVLQDHLASFFSISVLKGEPDAPGSIANTQLLALAERQDPIPLLAMEPALAYIRAGGDTSRFESFRALAACAGNGGSHDDTGSDRGQQRF